MEREFVENSTAVAIPKNASTAHPGGTVQITDTTENTEYTKVEMMSATEYALLELLKDLAKGIPSARLAVGSGDTAYLPKGHIKDILTTAGYAPDFVEAVDGWEGPVDSCDRGSSEESNAGQDVSWQGRSP